MKTALSVIALVTALTLAPFAGGSFAVADDAAQRGEHARFSPEDRAAFLDARIAALRAGLELNADQEKNWAPLESAMRDLAKQRAERFAAWKERRDADQDDQAGRRGQSGRSPHPRIRALERPRRRPAKAGRGREAPLRQPGRWPEAPVRCAFPRGHGPWPVAPCFSVGPWATASGATDAATAEDVSSRWRMTRSAAGGPFPHDVVVSAGGRSSRSSPSHGS